MNGFLRRLLNYDTLDAAIGLASQQQALIEEQQAALEELNAALHANQLEYARNTRNLIEQFFVAQEAGLDVRDELQAGLRDMQDEVARLEEHAQS